MNFKQKWLNDFTQEGGRDLLHFLRSSLNNDGDAEELAQEVSLRPLRIDELLREPDNVVRLEPRPKIATEMTGHSLWLKVAAMAVGALIAAPSLGSLSVLEERVAPEGKNNPYTVELSTEERASIGSLALPRGDDGEITIVEAAPERKEPQAERNNERRMAYAALEGRDKRVANEEEILEEIIVKGVTFNYLQTTSGTKMDMPIKDTPQTVLAVTEDMIDFASIKKFEDVYKVDATGGVSHLDDGGSRNYYRGFILPRNSINTIKVDGFRMSADFTLDLTPYERFEIVKGATSTLYGQNSVGGTLNAISKKPKAGPIGAMASFEAGSFNHYRGELDLYGSQSPDDRLTFRFIGAYQDSGTFYDFGFKEVFVLAPSLQYEISPDTTVRMSVNYQEHDILENGGYGAHFRGPGMTNPEIPDMPRSRLANAPWARYNWDALLINGLLERRFSNNWMLRTNLQYNRVDGLNHGFFTRHTNEDGMTEVVLSGGETEEETYAAEVNLFGDVELLGGTYTLFFGADYSELPFAARYPFETIPADSSPFSLLDPDYSAFAARSKPSDYTTVFLYNRNRRIMGTTVQAILRPVSRLQVILGARNSRDELQEEFGCCTLDTPVTPAEEVTRNAVTFQAGATYAITEDINLYASYGETYEPSTMRIFDGSLIDPEEGRAYEAGVKGELFNGNLLWTAALFHIDRTNIASSDPAHPGFSFPVGTQRSKGMEFDARGEVGPGWDIFFSIGVLDAEFIDGDFDGARPANAPKFGLSFFTSYEFQSGAFRGLGVGGGIVHKSGRETNDLDGDGSVVGKDFFADFTELDLRVFYSRANWRFDLTATNVLDTLYYSSRTPRLLNGISPNPPRTIRGSFSYKF